MMIPQSAAKKKALCHTFQSESYDRRALSYFGKPYTASYLASLSSSNASVMTLFFNAGRLMDSFGLCALAFGSSGPVTSTCAFGKMRCNSGMNGMEQPRPC